MTRLQAATRRGVGTAPYSAVIASTRRGEGAAPYSAVIAAPDQVRGDARNLHY